MEKQFLFDTPNYFTFVPKDNTKRDLVMISPGGGYHHTSLLEAFNVAKFFNDLGFHACVLNYRETLDIYPFPQKCLAYTIDTLRKRDDVDRIISIGFSAGAHLTLSNAIYYDEYGYNSKPDFLILCYPVITSNPKYWHPGSFDYLLKETATKELLDKMSLERHIPSDLPPVFLWHCFTDESVVVNNSLLLLEALKEKNISCEAHFFNEGVHGMSLSDETTGTLDARKNNSYVHRWTTMVTEWINKTVKKH